MCCIFSPYSALASSHHIPHTHTSRFVCLFETRGGDTDPVSGPVWGRPRLCEQTPSQCKSNLNNSATRLKSAFDFEVIKHLLYSQSMCVCIFNRHFKWATTACYTYSQNATTPRLAVLCERTITKSAYIVVQPHSRKIKRSNDVGWQWPSFASAREFVLHWTCVLCVFVCICSKNDVWAERENDKRIICVHELWDSPFSGAWREIILIFLVTIVFVIKSCIDVHQPENRVCHWMSNAHWRSTHHIMPHQLRTKCNGQRCHI